MDNSRRLAIAGAMLIASITGAASASPVTYIGSAGGLNASVTFETSGTDLVVTLTNTSVIDVLVPSAVLTALYYDVEGAPLGLSRLSASIGPTSVVHFGGSDPGGVVGGEWAYYASAVATPFGQDYAITSAGLGLSGIGGLFPGSNLQGPINVDGLQYGITSLGDNPLTGNSAVTGAVALIQNQVIFHLTGLPSGFDPSTSIRNVAFQYGTSNCATQSVDVCIPGVPEPGTLGVLASAMLLMLGGRTRPRR